MPAETNEIHLSGSNGIWQKQEEMPGNKMHISETDKITALRTSGREKFLMVLF